MLTPAAEKGSYSAQDPKEPALSAAKGLLCDQKCFPNMGFLQIPIITLQKRPLGLRLQGRLNSN
jgi:hypothetical protein